jgi:hypothetical protein
MPVSPILSRHPTGAWIKGITNANHGRGFRSISQDYHDIG